MIIGIEAPIPPDVLFAAKKVRRIYGKTCSGFCVQASDKLKSALRGHGHTVRTIQGFFCSEDHVWIELDKQFVLDVTADQFNFMDGIRNKPIVFCPKNLFAVSNKKAQGACVPLWNKRNPPDWMCGDGWIVSKTLCVVPAG